MDFATIYGLFQKFTATIGRIKEQAVQAELQGVIIQLQNEIMRVQEENATLMDENQKLRANAEERPRPSDYRFDGKVYWKDERPHCMRCFEEDKKARTLFQPDPYTTSAKCATCSGVFHYVFRQKTRTPLAVPAQERRPLDGL